MNKRLSERIGNCKIKSIAFVVFLIFLVVVGIFIYNHYFAIEFVEVYREECFDMPIGSIWRSTKEYADTDGIYEYTDKEIFYVEFSEYDLDEYTYVVSFGYELKEISCSLSELKRTQGFYFVPKMVFNPLRKDFVYIYRLPKIKLDCDIHNPNRNVYFE